MKKVKVECSICGGDTDCPENMLETNKHICANCFDRLEKFSNTPIAEFKKEIGELFNKMNWERIEKANIPDEVTPENLLRFINEGNFDGDWEKHIKHIQEHGTKLQIKEDIPFIKKLMKEQSKK